MNDSKALEAHTLTRRGCLRRLAEGAATATLSGLTITGAAGCGQRRLSWRSRRDAVQVGLLHSLTGMMAISDTSLVNAELMAIEEINAAGGVLNHRLEPIVLDGRSRYAQVFPRQARRLLAERHVAVVFGCWTSFSRKAVLPVFEELNGLLFYPVQYEGNESSRNIVYTGAVPNQQILPAIDWLLSEAGGGRRKLYLIGSDYVYPRTANLIIRKYLETHGVEVLHERYVPLGHADFREVVAHIRDGAPDAVVSTINGSSNVPFYAELAEQGLTADEVPVLATSVGEDELRSLPPEHVTGHLAAWTYFQSVESSANHSFIERFKAEFGQDCVTDDPIESAYSQVYLWKQAVEQAGSFEVDKVRTAFVNGIKFDGPGGTMTIDPKTQHVDKRFLLGRVRDDRQFDILYQSENTIAPDPYPEFAFPGWQCDWTKNGVTSGAVVRIGG